MLLICASVNRLQKCCWRIGPTPHGFKDPSLQFNTRFSKSYCTAVSKLAKLATASGGARPLFMAGHRQVISRINKGSQNILIYNFIITTFDCHGRSQGGGISARAFPLARPGVAPPLATVLWLLVMDWFRRCNQSESESFIWIVTSNQLDLHIAQLEL